MDTSMGNNWMIDKYGNMFSIYQELMVPLDISIIITIHVIVYFIQEENIKLIMVWD